MQPIYCNQHPQCKRILRLFLSLIILRREVKRVARFATIPGG
nr:MAG TPA: hypothetical protein [Caudoviricetes sp.]